jgi:hypothetical protein
VGFRLTMERWRWQVCWSTWLTVDGRERCVDL